MLKDFHIKMPKTTFEQMKQLATLRGSTVSRELNILALAEIKKAKKEENLKCI